jgi:hypothetical protein
VPIESASAGPAVGVDERHRNQCPHPASAYVSSGMSTIAASRGMTMRGPRAVAVVGITLLGTVASTIGSSLHRAVALASFGVAPPSCQYTNVTARLAPTGSVIYTASGTCTSGPNSGAWAINGTVSYDPGTQSFAERFSYNGVEVRTAGLCPTNPWERATSCTGQKVVVSDASALAVLQNHVSEAPFSLRVASAQPSFLLALASASRPNPPAVPVNVQAQAKWLQPIVYVRWLAPDESGDRPYTHFIVEARPAGAEGTPWTTLGGVARNGSGVYATGWRLPPPVPGYASWVVHACAATALASTCSAPQVPASQQLPLQKSGTALARLALPPVPVNVRFAVQATQVSAAWQLPVGVDPGLIERFVLEEKPLTAAEDWHALGTTIEAIPVSGSAAYQAHAVRAASFGSFLRVCSERDAPQACSQGIRVVSFVNSLPLDRASAFRSLAPQTTPQPAAVPPVRPTAPPNQKVFTERSRVLPSTSAGGAPWSN